ncbi:MAG: aminomethyl-transferring glycine dehydrogenase subunit GcvPA [Actinomycetota bacterium]
MNYTPHTAEELAAMLQALGISSTEELFASIPPSVRLNRALEIDGPVSEPEIWSEAVRLAGYNVPVDDLVCFAGGGAYDHYVPAVIAAAGGRAEFLTAYTPYQPELSQGSLQALFEYQTMVCELTGMDVANSSLYDGAGALAEAAHLAAGATGRRRIVVSEAVNPGYRSVLETTGAGPGYEFQTAPAAEGTTGEHDLSGAACLIVGQPNFYGCIEDLRVLAGRAHEAGALLVVHYDPLSAGILEAPGALGADVVTGEGQVLGGSLNFGGPYLGLFAARSEYLRRMPGRIVGEACDSGGRRGYVLTLQAREQHIRREKATSNICTDQTLLAIGAAVYLSWLGPRGLEDLGRRCWGAAHFAAGALSEVPGCSLAYDRPFFKEFALKVPGSAAEVVRLLAERGFLAGPVLGPDVVLVAVTELRTPEQIRELADSLKKVLS